MLNELLFGSYITEKFSDIYSNYEDFLDDYNNLGFPKTLKNEDTLKTIFILLYGKYGNSNILYTDINQFRFQLFSLIFQHGANWERKVELSEIYRSLNENEILTSSKQIVNHAYNPSTLPSTQSLEELEQINEQTTSGYKKNKIDAYMLLYDVLKDDYTDDFLRKFKKLFIAIVMPQAPLWYITEKED